MAKVNQVAIVSYTAVHKRTKEQVNVKDIKVIFIGVKLNEKTVKEYLSEVYTNVKISKIQKVTG